MRLFDFNVTIQWSRMVNIAKIVIKVARLWRPQQNNLLSVSQQRKQAERVLILEAQKDITEGEVRNWNLDPDQGGVLRIKDRLQQIGVDNQPIYLLKEHRIVQMLVLGTHRRCGHIDRIQN
uniref:DUF5641 domain-containing protein n=1 Tax=Syphacia muris TaxID=451379 RepID=A0A0N5B1K0_9BILA